MGQVIRGLRSVLSRAGFYDLFQNAVGAERSRRVIAREYLKAAKAESLSILDLGCGTARILRYLPFRCYLGLDFSPAYIQAARLRYPNRGEFLVADVSKALYREWAGRFDFVLMLGLLHHLDDGEAGALLSNVGPALNTGGCVVTVDPTIAPRSHPVSRFLAAQDRGCNVRVPDAYAALAAPAYDEITLTVRHDLLRIPYSHAILECRKPRS
jgi:SAM-dependent methyltransferase